MSHTVAARIGKSERRLGTLPLAPRHLLIPLLLAALCSSSAVATAQQHKAEAPVPTAIYVTKSGDTLYAIAAHYLRDPRDWTVLSRLNHVPAPRHLQPGFQVRLPVALLKQEPLSANVVAVSGLVEHAFREGPYTPLLTNTTLGESDRLRTSHNGFATLELADGTHLSVPQDSRLDLGTLRQTTLTGATDREFDLRRGEVDSEGTHASKPDDHFQIRSPSVVAGVRGTNFRVHYETDDQVSAVEVLDGLVGVTPPTDMARTHTPRLQAPPEQLVHAHFGSLTHGRGEVGTPVALLAAPELSQPAKMQDETELGFDLTPLPGAQAYRVQIARDAGLLDMIAETRVNAPHASFANVADGNYFVRISALDHSGLEGLPKIYAFERRQFGLAATAGMRPASRDYEFRWFAGNRGIETRFRFVLASTPDLHNPIVDQVDMSAGQIVVSNLPRGVYYWTIIGEQFENGKFYEKANPITTFTLDY